MNGYKEDNSCCCYFHPTEVVVGVCALCLNERLLVLASKQGNRSSARSSRRIQVAAAAGHKKPPIHLPKIFALGSLLNRLEFKHWKSDASEKYHDASTSQEDSFISIKFEENGVASWEKGTVSKVSLENCSMSWNPTLTLDTNKSVIEHAKPRASLRWRKRIGHLFQLVRWKRSSNANVCHVGSAKVDGVKVRKGWIKTLTKRTKE